MGEWCTVATIPLVCSLGLRHRWESVVSSRNLYFVGFSEHAIQSCCSCGRRGRGEGFDAIIAGVGSVEKQSFYDSSAYFPTTLVILFVIFSQLQKYFVDLWDSYPCGSSNFAHHSSQVLMIEVFATPLFNANARFAARETRSLLSRKNPPERFT